MQPPSKPFANLRRPESAPDRAGLEPATQTTAQLQIPVDRHGKPLLDVGKLVAGAVSVKSILILALPTIAEQLFSAVIGITDTKVAGLTGTGDVQHAAAAAAVGAMTYLAWFAGLMTAALGVGATAIVARSIGGGRPRLANRVAGSACSAAFLIGIVVALFFFAFPHLIVAMFDLHDLAGELGAEYLRIMSITVCCQTAGQIGMACLRGAGDTFRPMLVTFATTILNAIASPALTFGWWGLPAWGIKGNATGTLLAFALAGILTVAFLISGKAGLKLRLRHFRIVPHLVKRVLKIGLPSWAEGMLLWGGQVGIVIFAISPTDKAVGISGATLAAHTATLRIESLAFLPGFGFGIACSSLVGQYLGAGKPDEAQRATTLSNRLAFITMTLAALPMVFIPRHMLQFMVDSPTVIKVGFLPLIIAGLAQPGFAIGIIKSSALKGAGETVAPMLATITGMVLRIALVIGLLITFHAFRHLGWGLIAVWIAIFVDLNYRAVYTSIVFSRGHWRTKTV